MQYEPDAMLLRAEKAAILSRRGDYGPLTQSEAIFAVCRAVLQAYKALYKEGLTLQEQEQHLTLTAHQALAEAMAGSMPKAHLLAGIAHLPQPQQLVLSLKYGSDGCTDDEIAMILGCTPFAVRTLLVMALSNLMPRP